MKWLVLVLCIARYAAGGAIRCAADSGDASCTLEELTKEAAPNNSEDDIGTRLLDEVEAKEEIEEQKQAETDLENVEVNIYNEDRSFEELDYDIIEPDYNLQDTQIYEKKTNDLEDLDTVKDIAHSVLKRSVCKPNQMFQSECNTCKCGSDGQSYTCTQEECMEGDKNKEVEVFMESEGTDHVEKHSVCKPRGTFYIGCNTCHCNLYGTDYSCTNKPCPLPEDVEIFHELKEKSSKNKTKEIVCVANRMFIRDCNTCWCNEDGTNFFCTRKVCVPDLPEHGTEEEKIEGLRIIKKECRPDEVFELDCNMCRCNPDGKSFSCTRRVCVDPTDEESKNYTTIRKTRATEDTVYICKAGTEFRMDCNKCLCSNDGQNFSCTRIDCNGQNGNGRRKRDTAENVINTQENDVKTLVPQQDPNFVCNPGDAIKIKCNDCTCAADGKNVNCPVRLCDNDTTLPPIN